MDKNLDIFYYSGTHWDREWYQHFQGFRYRLVNMVDNLLEILEKNEEYKVFHFDGQTVILEDYTAISPEKASKLRKMINEGRILIGPWYVMPDEFLVSGESLIRNLMLGYEKCKEWGAEPWKYGYVCDVFGHIAQMPQIFNGFSINYSTLGRGTTETDPTFFRWQSPDGSECLTFRLAVEGYGALEMEVYHNDMITSLAAPEVENRLKKYVDDEINRSDIPIVVLMDGLDHTYAGDYTTSYLKRLSELYPNAEIHHTNLCEEGKLLEKYKDSLPIIKGELNKTAAKRHCYLHLITNTLSSYYTLKKANDECQNLLEKTLEPIFALAKLENVSLNRNYAKLAYKYLLLNQPHDSICGCSICDVHKDMEYRYSQVKQISKAVTDDYYYRTRRKAAEQAEGNYESIVTLYNTLPFAVDKTISIELDFQPEYPAVYSEPFDYEDINSFLIYDEKGNEIPYQVSDIKRNYTRRIVDGICKSFDVHKVTFRAQIPACGMSEYKIVPHKPAVRYLKKLKSGYDYAENEFIRMTILNNGALEIYDKKSQKTYTQLLNLSDNGEIGDGWYHVSPVADRVVSTYGGSCRIEKIENGPSRCVFCVTRELTVPKEMVEDKHGIKRSDETVSLKVVTYVGLSEESRYVDVKLEFDNTAKDHRLRLIIPSGIATDSYFSGQAFYCVKRKVGIDFNTQNWRETDRYEKATNGILGKRDENEAGIAFVSACGLHECAAYDDEDGTLLVTLLRAFKRTTTTNGEEDCQLNQPLSYEFYLAPIDKTVEYADLLKLQDILACPIRAEMVNVGDSAVLNPSKSVLEVDGLAVSVIKCAENDKNAIAVRVWNPSDKEKEGVIKTSFEIKSAELTNMNEEFISKVPTETNKLSVKLSPWKVATYLLYY